MVPFDVYHGRKGVRILRNVADKPVRLLARHPTPVEEVIGAAAQSRLLRLAPVLVEHRVEMVSAVGGLDVGEIGALGTQLVPIDITLPARNIDAMYRQMLG